MSNHLVLSVHDKSSIIIYRRDEDGNPILNSKDVLLMFFRGVTGYHKIDFNGRNYEIIRYELMKEGPLKQIVDEKLAELGRRIE